MLAIAQTECVQKMTVQHQIDQHTYSWAFFHDQLELYGKPVGTLGTPNQDRHHFLDGDNDNNCKVCHLSSTAVEFYHYSLDYSATRFNSETFLYHQVIPFCKSQEVIHAYLFAFVLSGHVDLLGINESPLRTVHLHHFYSVIVHLSSIAIL